MDETRDNPGGAGNLENLTAMITKLQQRLQDQQEEICALWQQNQGQEGEVGRGGAPPPPPPPLGQDQMFQMYERFRHMNPKEFEGSTSLVVVEECLNSVQIILDFMNLTDQDKVQCTTFMLKTDARYW